MSRELQYKAFIIKKQSYGEADEIVTFFTKEAGKLRALGKSVKYSKSKLQYALQTGFLVNVTTTHNSGLAKVIHVTIARAYTNMRQNQGLVSCWFVIAELFLKATGDGHKNEALFQVYEEYMDFLDSPAASSGVGISLLKFKIHFLEALGLAIHNDVGATAGAILFSNSTGSFFRGQKQYDAVEVLSEAHTLFGQFKELTYERLPVPSAATEELSKIVTNFISYQLEREIQSESFLPKNG